MNSIELMMDEHRNIERMLKIIRALCLRILKNEKVDYDDIEIIIEFIRKYADGHHHNKEEIFLFNKMVDSLGPLGEKIIKYGMLVEHDLGRLYVKNLEEALNKVRNGDEEAKLDIIANVISYTDLLTRHIDKEDRVVYTFAQRELSEEILNEVDNKCNDYEKDNLDLRNKYINILNNLEEKY